MWRTSCLRNVMLYLDSSALVKRYVLEAGSDLVRASIVADPYVATTIVTAVEVRAALAAASRSGRITNLAAVVSAARRDWLAYIVVNVDTQLIERAAQAAEQHALRGYDAVQLASALAMARAAGSTVRFGTFDLALRRAAVADGLTLLFS